MTPAGLEPAIPGPVGRCLIHWATGPLVVVSVDGTRRSSCTAVNEDRADIWQCASSILAGCTIGLYPWALGSCGLFPGVSQGPQFRGHWLSVMWGVQS